MHLAAAFLHHDRYQGFVVLGFFQFHLFNVCMFLGSHSLCMCVCVCVCSVSGDRETDWERMRGSWEGEEHCAEGPFCSSSLPILYLLSGLPGLGSHSWPSNAWQKDSVSSFGTIAGFPLPSLSTHSLSSRIRNSGMCGIEDISHREACISLPVFHIAHSRLNGTRRNSLFVSRRHSLFIMSNVLLLFSQEEQQIISHIKVLKRIWNLSFLFPLGYRMTITLIHFWTSLIN